MVIMNGLAYLAEVISFEMRRPKTHRPIMKITKMKSGERAAMCPLL